MGKGDDLLCVWDDIQGEEVKIYNTGNMYVGIMSNISYLLMERSTNTISLNTTLQNENETQKD